MRFPLIQKTSGQKLFRKKMKKCTGILVHKNILSILIILSMTIPLFSSCARWKVEDLKPAETIMIPFGEENHQIRVTRNDKGIFNTPTEVALDDDNYYVADIKGAKILILSRDTGEIKEVIGNVERLKAPNAEKRKNTKKKTKTEKTFVPSTLKNNPKTKDTAFSKNKEIIATHTFSKKSREMAIHDAPIVYPGKIQIMANGILLVQNRIPLMSRYDKKRGHANQTKEYIPETAPSHILVFDGKRKIIGKIIRDKKKNISFKQILGLYSKSDEEIIVISRDDPKSWYLQSFRFPNYEEKFSIKITPQFILEKDDIPDKKDYLVYIENIIPRYNKKEFLISAAFYKNERFKFRRIFLLDSEKQDRLSLYTELQEPQNELYASLENNSIYLWSSESYHEIKLKIYDPSGDLINNKKIRLFGKDEAWRNFIAIPNGNIIALYVSRIGMEIILWS